MRSRSENPPQYYDYKRYKPFLRKEFNYACAYCDSNEAEVGGAKRTHIDHYRPKSKFRQLVNIYTNLFYSCPECNQVKKDYWPTTLQRLAKQFILNPFDHDIAAHIDKSDASWSGISNTGRWNIIKLMLCTSEQVERRNERKLLLEMVTDIEGEIVKAKSLAQKSKNKANATNLLGSITKLEMKIRAIRSKILAPEQL